MWTASIPAGKSLGSESGSDDDDFFVGAANLRLGDEAALFARTEPPPMDGDTTTTQ